MKSFHHALKFRNDICIGCSHCTGICPTGAIHIDGGYPVLNPDRCIDCGMCYMVCPSMRSLSTKMTLILYLIISIP